MKTVSVMLSPVYVTPIDGLGKNGRVDEAYSVYERLLDSDCHSSSVIYTSLVRNFFNHAENKMATRYTRKCLIEAVLLVCSSLIHIGCVFKVGETEKERALFEEIKARRFIPDVRSYSNLIHGPVRAGFSNGTYELFYSTKELGCVLDTHAYNVVIDGFCKSGKVNKAYQLLEEIKPEGHEPTVVTYDSVNDRLSKFDRLDEAYMLFEEGKAKDIELNVIIYCSLIDGFGKVGGIDEAYLIMEELMQKGFKPNVYT